MARKASGETNETKAAKPRRTAATRRKPAPTAPTSVAASGHPSILPHSENQIRERAYFIYLERGGTPGDAVADWLRAEREVSQGTTKAGV